jgi:hypothetical protein
MTTEQDIKGNDESNTLHIGSVAIGSYYLTGQCLYVKVSNEDSYNFTNQLLLKNSRFGLVRLVAKVTLIYSLTRK